MMDDANNVALPFAQDLIEAFYTQPHAPDWQELAGKTGLSVQECQRQWQVLTDLAKTLAQIEMPEPSPLVLNRLSVLAREASVKPSFWQMIFSTRAALGFGVVIVLAALGVKTLPLSGRFALQSKPVQNVVAQAPTRPIFHFTPEDRMHEITLDEFAKFVANTNPVLPEFAPRQFSLATPVSLGQTDSNPWSLVDDVPLLQSGLNDKEVEAVFYRARKAEKQGHYHAALKDYQFLLQFYPGYLHPQSLHIAMARCLEGLGQEDDALRLLQKSQNKYGASEDLQFMMDQLKSVTF